MTLDRESLRIPLTLAVGLLTLGCGLLGVLGWHTGDPTLTQLLPELTPLSCGSSLYLVGLGAGWLASTARLARLSAAIGFGALFLALVAACPGFEGTLFRVFGPLVSAEATYLATPADFSPLSSAVGVLLACQLILKNTHPFRPIAAIAGLIPLAVACFGLDSLPWGLALASIGFWLVGVLEFRLPRGDMAMAIRVIPVLSVAGSTVATVLLWRAVAADEHAQTSRLIEAEADGVMQQLRSGLPAVLRRFDELGKSWVRKQSDQEEKHHSAGSVMGMVRSSVATYWVTPEGELEWVESGPRFPWNANLDERRKASIQRFLNEIGDSVDWSISTDHLATMNGRRHLMAFLPCPNRDRSGLLVVFNAEELLASMFADYHQSGNIVEIRKGSTLLFRQGELAAGLEGTPPQEFTQ